MGKPQKINLLELAIDINFFNRRSTAGFTRKCGRVAKLNYTGYACCGQKYRNKLEKVV